MALEIEYGSVNCQSNRCTAVHIGCLPRLLGVHVRASNSTPCRPVVLERLPWLDRCCCAGNVPMLILCARLCVKESSEASRNERAKERHRLARTPHFLKWRDHLRRIVHFAPSASLSLSLASVLPRPRLSTYDECAQVADCSWGWRWPRESAACVPVA